MVQALTVPLTAETSITCWRLPKCLLTDILHTLPADNVHLRGFRYRVSNLCLR